MGNPCLTPHCGKPSFTRGLCRKCYSVALGIVRDGVETWDSLAALGLALKASKRGPAIVNVASTGSRDLPQGAGSCALTSR